jgi:hypothetical protein
MLAGEPSRSASNDMLIAGLGLGGVIFAMSQLSLLLSRSGMPDTPTTVLNEAWPVLAGVTDIPMVVMMMVSIFGIPVLVAGGLSRRWILRAFMAAIIVALMGVVIWSLGPATDVNPAKVAMLIGRVAIVCAAVVFWGSLAAWSWVVAALAFVGLTGLRSAAYGVVWQERGAAALSLLVAAALILLIVRRTARARPPDNALTHI